MKPTDERLKLSYQIWHDNGTGYWEVDESYGKMSKADAVKIAKQLSPFGYRQLAVEIDINPNSFTAKG